MYSRRRNATIASGAVTAQGELDLDPPTPRQPSTPAPPWPPAALPTHALSTHSTATYGLLGQGGMGGPLSSQVSFPTTLSAESSGWPVTGREPAGNALPWLPDLGAGLGPEPSWLSSSSGQQQQEGQPGRGAAATVDTVVILPDRLSVYQHSFGDGAEASIGSFPRSHGRLGRRGHAHDAAAKQRQQDVSITGSVPDMSSRGPWRIQLASQASDVALSLPQESSTARSDNVMARAAPDDVNVLKQSYASRRKLRASTDGSKGMSAQRGVVRMIAVSKDHEPTLPLDCDQLFSQARDKKRYVVTPSSSSVNTTAPLLNDHKLSRPTLEDINYILHRWGTRWASEREEELAQRRRAPEVFDTLTPRTKDAVTAKTEYELIFDRPSAQLGLFGLPAPDASQNGMIWKDS
ncbi:hypothetical protein QJQ45_029389 [Haematococcus lacustris]|nr:hypothetical protein QJQ45_029389 [Haematococcus lacustris]